MDNARQQIVDSLKAKSNILVTVSTNPSVDELSAALGLTIILNNQDKRASAVFGGQIPPAITFLQPEKTFENTPDSLRDFIIALDKEKADHLRYKVEGEQVKIFITPYRTTLTQEDLEFSQGDYNVELVIALGVKNQDSLDKALEAHGKILHDAAVMTVTTGSDASTLGSVDWHDAAASSLSEMVVSIADGLKADAPIFDEQIATALLTGIVSATDRFSNERTSSRTMTVAAQLMAAGANQQLIAAKLEEAHDIAPGASVSSGEAPVDAPAIVDEPKKDDNELTIDRAERKSPPNVEQGEITIDQPIGEESDVAAADDSKEAADQRELEQRLVGLAAPATGTETMADIESELKRAAEEAESSIGATEDVSAPVADAAEEKEEAPAPEVKEETPQEPVLEPPVFDQNPVTEVAAAEPVAESTPEAAPVVEPATAPEQSSEVLPEVDPTIPTIIQDHGPMVSSNGSEVPPINGTIGNLNDGEQTIDPFLAPVNSQEASPMSTTNEGTLEGAELLASAPEASPVLDPIIPQLPPLPPLPMDGNLPPLPPPPPPPPVFQPGGPMPAGPVSGDVFGDGSSTTSAPSQPAVQPPEPGQFRIPGSPS